MDTISFQDITTDHCYTEQLLSPTKDDHDGYGPWDAYTKFLIANTSDAELITWFPDLAKRLGSLPENNDDDLAKPSPKYYILLLRDNLNNGVIGFIHFNNQLGTNCCEALELYLGGNFRRKKIMSEVLGKLIAFFRKNGISDVKANVDAKNENSIAFLKQNEFEEISSNNLVKVFYKKLC